MEQMDKLAAALVKAQGEIGHAIKNKKGHNNRYADLTECLDAARPHMVQNGIAIIQFPTVARELGYVGLTTTLMHSTGQSMSDTMEMKPTKYDPQTIGACLTYMRRYMYAAVTGLGQVDDDGKAASRKAKAVGEEESQFTADDKTKILAKLEKLLPEQVKGFGPPHTWDEDRWVSGAQFIKDSEKNG